MKTQYHLSSELIDHGNWCLLILTVVFSCITANTNWSINTRLDLFHTILVTVHKYMRTKNGVRQLSDNELTDITEKKIKDKGYWVLKISMIKEKPYVDKK